MPLNHSIRSIESPRIFDKARILVVKLALCADHSHGIRSVFCDTEVGFNDLRSVAVGSSGRMFEPYWRNSFLGRKCELRTHDNLVVRQPALWRWSSGVNMAYSYLRPVVDGLRILWRSSLIYQASF